MSSHSALLRHNYILTENMISDLISSIFISQENTNLQISYLFGVNSMQVSSKSELTAPRIVDYPSLNCHNAIPYGLSKYLSTMRWWDDRIIHTLLHYELCKEPHVGQSVSGTTDPIPTLIYTQSELGKIELCDDAIFWTV